MRQLQVWDGFRHIGVFIENDAGDIDFRYDSDAPSTPVSICLPRDGGWDSSAPANFLDNLLPDNPNIREAMRTRLRTASTDAFDLLDGVDATGGLTFTLSDERPRLDGPLLLATDEEIANEIVRIERTPSFWWDEDSHCRFSLGGAQGKFTLTSIDGQWFWPDAALPSTHIIKPRPKGLEHALEIEGLSMDMAAACGVPTPEHGMIEALGRVAYIVERFDRRVADGSIRRIRQEDFLQSLGRPVADKYEVGVDECLDLLERVDPTNELCYQWLERVSFNMSVGNSDAHAKNYSFILDESGISLAPAYDIVATRFWPIFDQELAMPLEEDCEFAEWTTPKHWERLALRHGLDSDRVVDAARRMAGKVLAHAPRILEAQPASLGERLERIWRKVNESMEPIVPAIEQTESPHAAVDTFSVDPSDPTGLSINDTGVSGPIL